MQRALPTACEQYRRTRGPWPFPHRTHFLWCKHVVSTKLYNGWTMNSTEGTCHKGLQEHVQVWVDSGTGSPLGWSVTTLLEQRTPETCWGPCRHQGYWSQDRDQEREGPPFPLFSLEDISAPLLSEDGGVNGSSNINEIQQIIGLGQQPSTIVSTETLFI